MKLHACVSLLKQRELWASVVWALGVVLPSALIDPSAVSRATRARLASHYLGDITAAYLGAAPAPLVFYALLGTGLTLPVLLVLLSPLQAQLHGRVNVRDTLSALGQRVLYWAAMLAVGAGVVGAVAVLRGGGEGLFHGGEAVLPEGMASWGEAVASWGVRLTLLGAIASLPVLGLVLAALALFRRHWSSVFALGFALALAMWGSLHPSSHGVLPSPLRAALFSGRPELFGAACWGLLSWSSAGALVAALAVWGRQAWRSRARAVAASPAE